MSSIYDWSTTAASNSNSDASINWAEGQAPSTVNDSARQVMARVAEFRKDLGGATAAGGTSSALTLTANSAFAALADGLVVAFRASADAAASATLNVNALGAKSIRKMLTSGEAALAGGEIKNTGLYVVLYSSALNSAAGGWLLLNPSQIDSSTLVTLTGSQTLTNKTLTSPVITGGTIDNAVIGGTTPASITGTNGSFTGTLSATGAVTFSNTLTVTGAVTTSAAVVASNFQAAVATPTQVVLATNGASAGTVFLRPNGPASATGQMSVANTGAVTINGTLTVTG